MSLDESKILILSNQKRSNWYDYFDLGNVTISFLDSFTYTDYSDFDFIIDDVERLDTYIKIFDKNVKYIDIKIIIDRWMDVLYFDNAKKWFKYPNWKENTIAKIAEAMVINYDYKHDFSSPMLFDYVRRKPVEEWLLKKGNNFCSMPYIHMAIESNGDIKPCCYGKPIENGNDKLNISGSTIGESYMHPARHEWIDSFDKNEQSKLCINCWKDNNRYVNRIKFSVQRHAIDFTEEVMLGEKAERKLKWLEIKPGNRCNLKCRICGVHNSSQWTKDAYQLNYETKRSLTADTFKESEEFKWTQQCEWIDEEKVWNDINGMGEDLELIHIMGGEPFMVPEHFTLLQKIIEDQNLDHANIDLRYNTNGTKFPDDEQMEIIRQFRSVEMQLSIDDIGKRFEYARNLGVWDEVEENLKKFSELNKTTNRLFNCRIDCTVSMFNIFYLDEFEKKMNELGFSIGKYADHYVMAHWNDIRYLSDAAKQKVIEHYPNPSDWTSGTLKFMLESKPPAQTLDFKNKFMSTVNILDRLRKENFAEVYPEWYSILEEYNK